MFKKRKMNEIVVPDDIEVIDYTGFENVTPIVSALANKIFGYERLRIRVFPLSNIFQSDTVDYWGITRRAVDRDASYSIFLNKKIGPYKLRKTLSHEFVHVDQMEKRELQITGSQYLWKGESGDMLKVKYNDRPFEIDAMRRQKKVLRDLNRILYK